MAALLLETLKAKNTFLMVKKCSYCVSKVPNDDGPSMSIIEFCLRSLEAQQGKALAGTKAYALGGL